MPSNPVIQRMSRAIYKKCESLGVDIDPEGCGDLSRATLVAIAAFDAICDKPNEEKAE